MAAWPFTPKTKEQDERQIPAAAATEGEEITGTNSLDALIAATKNSPLAVQEKEVIQVPMPGELIRPDSHVLPAKDTERTPAESGASMFGILTLEEQQRLDEENAKPPEEKKAPRKRKKLGRTIEVKVRVTEDEKKLLDSRVLASGESQGEFIRHAILHEKIETRRVFAVDAQAMSALMRMGSELGKIGGLIKKTVVVNKEFAVFTQDQKSQYESLMRDLERLKNEMQKVVQEIYGHSKT